MALSKIDSDGIVANGITADSLNIGQIGGRRNLIINGAMQVAQRGTSATAMTNTYATVDRFRGFSNGSGAFTGEQYSMSNAELSTTGHSKALKMLVSTADSSIDAADYYALQYKFEGDDLQHLQYGSSSAKSFTVSFWAKSDTTGTYFLTVDKIANGQTAYRLPIEYIISNADTWEYKTLTVSPTAGSTSFITSSAGAIGGGTGHGLSLYFGFAWGTNYHGTNNTWAEGSYGTNASANGWMSTVGNDFYITGVQLEVGTVATPFEHRSYGEELALCQRYYVKITSSASNDSFGVGVNEDTTRCFTHHAFPVPMRADPTAVESTGTATDYEIRKPGTTVTCSAVPEFVRASEYGSLIRFIVSGGLTQGQGGQNRAANGNAFLAWSAEL